MAQLTLPIRLDDHAVFESYYPVGNEAAVDHLCRLADGDSSGAWLTGSASSGKTHLLQACCARAGDQSVFLGAGLLKEAGPGMLEGLEMRRLVAIDDVDHLLGNDDWEAALFDLYNRLQEGGVSLVLSASSARRDAGIRLADLASRFAQLPGFSLSGLDDAGRMTALQLRARLRGLELPPETATYLVTRTRRDMRSLYTLLDTLDEAALRDQRRLTIPFVRDVIGA